MLPYVNIHTHRPTGRGIVLRTAGIHPWEADLQAAETLAAQLTGKGPEYAAGFGPAAGNSRAGVIEIIDGLSRAEAGRMRPETEGAAAEAASDAGVPGGIGAIGEIGLDFACTADRAVQIGVLRSQLALARQLALPVVLHCVRAFEPLMRELADCEPRAVIFHGFVGSPEQGRQALRRGYFLSFGERAFASPKTLRTLGETPLERLFLETDDADLPIERIYARAAEAKGVTVEALQRATLENYERIFGKRNG